MSFYFRKESSDEVVGPHSFREMVLLVADGEIGPDDKAREDDSHEWIYAGDIPGLFKMADRDDVLSAWYAEQATRDLLADRPADEDCLDDEWGHETEFDDEILADLLQQEAAVSTSKDDDEPAWRRRLRQVEQEREEAAAVAGAESKLGSMAAAAVAEIERKEQATQKVRRFAAFTSTLLSTDSLKRVVRVVFTIVAANATAFGVINWSEQQAQRFPDRQMLASGVREFPLYGTCSSGEFMFLTLDVMILAGLAGYFASRWLEVVADD